MLLCVLRQVHPYILLQLNGQPAIDDKRMAGDERSLARAQEDNRIGDVDGRAGSSQRVLLLKEAQSVRMIFPTGTASLGHDVARTNRIDTDARRPIFSRKLACQANHRRFDRLIHTPAGCNQQSVHRRDVDHRSTARRDQVRNGVLGCTEHRLQADVERAVPCFFGGRDCVATPAARVGIVDHDGQTTPQLDSAHDHRLHALKHADISHQRRGFTATSADAFDVALRLATIDVDHQDASTLLSEAARCGSADTPRTACHDRYLINQSLHNHNPFAASVAHTIVAAAFAGGWECMKSDPIRIGLVGAGRILPAHLRGYQLLRQAGVDSFCITAITSRMRRDAESFVERDAGPVPRAPVSGEPSDPLSVHDVFVSDFQRDVDVKVYDSLDVMLAADAVDALDISATLHVHHTAALKGIRYGKHCVVQKPLAISVAAGRAMVEAAQQRGVSLGVMENLRYAPRVRVARWLIDHHYLGAIQMIARWSIGTPEWSPNRIVAETPWRHQKLVAGGGATRPARSG